MRLVVPSGFGLWCAVALFVAAGIQPVAAVEGVTEEIVVRSIRSQSGVPASVGALEQEDIDLLRPTHISEALARVPGVWISRGSGQEHLTAIRSAVLTGAGACGEFLYLEDGLPIRPTGFCNINNLFELNTEQAQAIEVWRGPGSAVLGGNALRGAINVMTRQPTESRFSVEGGPYGYAQVRGESGLRVGGFDVGTSALATRSDGYRSQTGYEQYKTSTVVTGDIGNWQVRGTLSASLLHQETGGFVGGFEAYEDSDLRDTNPNPEAYRDAWSWRAALAFERDGWTVTPYVRRSKMQFLQHFLPGQPREDNEQTSGGILAQHQWTGDVERTVGAQVEYFSGSLRENQIGPTTGSAFLVATRPEGLHYDYDVDGYSVAAFYNVRWPAGDQLYFVHSGRVEYLRYDYDNDTLVGNTRDDGTPCGFGGCLYTRPADRDDQFTNAAGRLGIEWHTDGAGIFYGVIGTGFRPPQATELYRLQRGQLVADLDSERLNTVEIGYKSDRIQIAAFAERTRDFIFRDAQGRNVSDGKTKSYGVEAALAHKISNHHLSVALTLARHRYDFDRQAGLGEVIEEGNDVDTAPRVLANARWRYDFSDTLYQEVELQVLGKHYVNAANTARYDGHEVLNWRGVWQATPKLQVYARLINVLDEEYADRADFAFGGFRYFPAMPRQFYLGVDFTL